MKKPIFTALSPNAERDDIFLAFKLLFCPWKWKVGNACPPAGRTGMRSLQMEIKKYFDVRHVFLLSSGRASLYAILRALNLNSEDEVLLQAYTCVAVPNSILWVGAKPVYVDIVKESFNMDTKDLRKKITPKSKVLIIQHTFGLPANVDELIAIAKEKNLFVIEDCAHALGAKYNGKLVGTFGDASFLSFGRDKIISSVFGGAIVTNNDFLAEKIEKEIASYPFPNYFWIFQQLLHPVFLHAVKNTYTFFGLGKFLQKFFRVFHILSLAVTKDEKQSKMPDWILKKMSYALTRLALNQFQKLELMNAHRQKIASMYENEFIGRERMPVRPAGGHAFPTETKNALSIFLRYTIQTRKAREIFEALKKENIFLGDWYWQVVAPEGVDNEKIGYQRESCSVAEELAKVSLNLPTHIGVSESDAKRIITKVKQYL